MLTVKDLADVVVGQSKLGQIVCMRLVAVEERAAASAWATEWMMCAGRIAMDIYRAETVEVRTRVSVA